MQGLHKLVSFVTVCVFVLSVGFVGAGEVFAEEVSELLPEAPVLETEDLGSEEGEEALETTPLIAPLVVIDPCLLPSEDVVDPCPVTNIDTTEEFPTIQAAIDDSDTLSGHTIEADPGVYPETVTVYKSVVLHGAQDGVDAHTRAGAESTVGTAGGAFVVTANDVVIDGFTISGVSGGYGAGVHTNGSVTGTEIRNNVISGNVMGVYFNGTDVIVERNLIKDNTLPGAAGGSGIYTDQGLTNAVIQNNTFTGHTNVSINLATGGEGMSASNVDILGNEITNDSTIYVIDATDVMIDGNTITGSAAHGIQLDGGNDEVVIQDNSITNSHIDGWSGIRIGTNYGPNDEITITRNYLTGGYYGIRSTDLSATVNANFNDLNNNVVGAEYLPGDDAGVMTLNLENNWWGCPEGPASGDPDCAPLSGATSFIDFTPWLCGPFATDPLSTSDGTCEGDDNGGGGGGAADPHDGDEDDDSDEDNDEEDEDEEGEVLGESAEGLCPFLDVFVHPASASPWAVMQLQAYLNVFEDANLAINGIFDDATLRAVLAYQVKYHNEILEPWVEAGHLASELTPTGYVYLTTKKHINERVCPGYTEALPPLVPDQNVHNGTVN
jgi:parallel beta-helix repeat protein